MKSRARCGRHRHYRDWDRVCESVRQPAVARTTRRFYAHARRRGHRVLLPSRNRHDVSPPAINQHGQVLLHDVTHNTTRGWTRCKHLGNFARAISPERALCRAVMALPFRAAIVLPVDKRCGITTQVRPSPQLPLCWPQCISLVRRNVYHFCRLKAPVCCCPQRRLSHHWPRTRCGLPRPRRQPHVALCPSRGPVRP